MEPTLKSKALSKSSIEKTSIEKTSSKRLLCNASFEKILDDDLRIQAKRARKSYEQDKTLVGLSNPVPLRASMLSPNLRQRFAHLLV